MFFRHRAAVGLGIFGAIFKGVCVAAADIALFAWAIKLAIDGRWVAAALWFFIGIPIASIIVDIASGVVVALILGIAVLVGWKAAEPPIDDEDEFFDEDLPSEPLY